MAGLTSFLKPRQGSPWAGNHAVAERLYRDGLERAARGDTVAALAKFEKVRALCARTPLAGSANFQAGSILEQSGRFSEAWLAYQKVADEYPDSGHFSSAVRAQLVICGELIRRMELVERGQLPRKMLQRLTRDEILGMTQTSLANARTAEGTAESSYQLAIALQQYGRPEDARSTLLDLAAHHPEHHLADDASFQAAMITANHAARPNATDADREKAITAFSDFLAVHPDSEKAPEAAHRLAASRRHMVLSLAAQATQWEQQGKSAAAAVCYRTLAVSYADLMADFPSIREKAAAASPVTPASSPPEPDRTATPMNPLDPVRPR
jgi:TolA-binding protein